MMSFLRRRRLFALLPASTLAAANAAPVPAGPVPPQRGMRLINRTDGNYSQAVEVRNPGRLVFVSGQVGVDEKGKVPSTFREQAMLAWANVAVQLREAGMTVADIVKMTIFLSDRKYRGEAYETRHLVLGEHAPAMSIVICGIYREEWLLEIEAIAAA